MAMVMMTRCRASDGAGGRCPARAVRNCRCTAHNVDSSVSDCSAPDKIIVRFGGVTEAALAAAGIPIVERTRERADEMARIREDVGFRGMNPFFQEGEGKDGRMRKNHIFLGRVGGAVAEVLQQGFRIIVDAHGLRGEDRRGNEMLTLVVTLAKSGQDRDRALEVLALVANEAEKVCSFFVNVNPRAEDRMTGRMVVVHTVNCKKAQVGAPAKASLRYDGGFWGLATTPPPAQSGK